MEKTQTKEQNEPEESLPDLSLSTQESEDAKAGSISLNYTKVEFKNVGMGTANQ